MPLERYLPIRDHGAIGNLRTTALVGLDATIDWLCLPDLESPALFGGLLDARRGGHFSVRLADACAEPSQRYLPDTNVLETTLRGRGCRLVVTDFMPLAGDLAPGGAHQQRPELHRILRAEAGAAEVIVEWAPRFRFAEAPTSIDGGAGCWVATDGHDQVVLRGLDGGSVVRDTWGPLVQRRFRLAAGTQAAWVMGWGEASDPAGSGSRLRETVDAWRRWLHGAGSHACAWAGSDADAVARSLLALKLLTHAETGAVAAAATTSLPAEPGGVRNWDYRYAWIRDTSFTAQAFTATGHPREAHAFLAFVERVAERCGAGRHPIRILYGLHGGEAPHERVLEHLEGYRGARPVRVGNRAAEQRQLDVYGEVLDAAYDLVRAGADLSPPLRSFLSSLADAACANWHLPDEGIWEVRARPRHFVHSKVMCWAGLDRAVQLAELGFVRGDVHRWRRTARTIREAVLRYGYDRDRRTFVQAFDGDELDGATLVLPLLEFLPAEDERIQGTIAAVRRELEHGGLVYRYRGGDGLPGLDSGAFGLVTFWLVDALALSGRLDEAEALFRGLLGHANHLGLYAELIDPRTGAFHGNFPQAFTHVGLINSALYLAWGRGRPVPLAPVGSLEHRRSERHDPAAP